MRLSLPFILSSLLPAASALQTIYLGYITTNNRYGSYIAWFSDSDPCDGTSFGNIFNQFRDCDRPITILGHEGITFTGCQTPAQTPGANGGYPTGVSDDGAPALSCSRDGYPSPGSEGTFIARCNGPSNFGYVTIIEYCS